MSIPTQDPLPPGQFPSQSAAGPGAVQDQNSSNPSLAPPARGRFLRSAWRLGAVLAGVFVCILIWKGLNGRAKAASAAAEATGGTPVQVAPVTREDLYNRVTITAEFRPYLKVELHAKVSGYVDEMNVDIGDQVKSGQLLARLEVPELRDELARAKATQQRSEADYHDAHLVYSRLQAVDKANPMLVAQQELDAAEAKDLTADAAVAAAKAEVSRLETMLAYTRITAPFDGVITHRYADPGALIQAGTASDTQSMPLVCLSDNYRLRVDSAVSLRYIQYVHVGDQVQIQVESLKGRKFIGTISRVTQKVDDDTRTMIIELDVANPKLELVPGMYATANFDLDRRPHTLAIPTDAIDEENRTSVLVVNADQVIESRAVTLGLETPDKYEVLSGLKEGDLVVVGGRALVRPGQKVHATIRDAGPQP